MKINKNAGIVHSENILNILQYDMNVNDNFISINENIYVSCFDNCREQGYILKMLIDFDDPLYIAIAEQRNSDNIVVYVYNKCAFPSNLPAENNWDNANYFEDGKIYDAVKYIKQTILEYCNKKIKSDE